MKYLNILLSIALLTILGCQEPYTSETLIEDIIAGEGGRISDQFWQAKYPLEETEFKEVLGQYSAVLQNSSLKKVAFEDDINFKSKDRLGYLFLDENNNVAYSITYKFVKAEKDGPDLINFIDFRSSEGDLPCLKFPTLFPVKCVKFPFKLPQLPAELRQEYPKDLHGYRFYHTQILNEQMVIASGDSLRPIIAFNINNLKVKNNLKAILDELASRIPLEGYLLAVNETYGVPSLNLTYGSNRFSDEEIQKIKVSVEFAINEAVSTHSYRSEALPFEKSLVTELGTVLIGGLGDEGDARIRF